MQSPPTCRRRSYRAKDFSTFLAIAALENSRTHFAFQTMRRMRPQSAENSGMRVSSEREKGKENTLTGNVRWAVGGNTR